MRETKERLIELIEAYAIAKTTSNNVLMSLAATATKTFIDSIEIVQKKAETTVDSEDFTMPEEVTNSSKTKVTKKIIQDTV